MNPFSSPKIKNILISSLPLRDYEFKVSNKDRRIAFMNVALVSRLLTLNSYFINEVQNPVQ